MRINGRAGKGTNTCAKRKRTKPTKAEKRLKVRLNEYDRWPKGRTHNPTGPESNGYHIPGSLKKP